MSDIELMLLGRRHFDAQEETLNKMTGEDVFGSRLFGQSRKSVVENVRKRLNDAGEGSSAEDFMDFDDKTLTLAKDYCKSGFCVGNAS